LALASLIASGHAAQTSLECSILKWLRGLLSIFDISTTNVKKTISVKQLAGPIDGFQQHSLPATGILMSE